MTQHLFPRTCALALLLAGCVVKEPVYAGETRCVTHEELTQRAPERLPEIVASNYRSKTYTSTTTGLSKKFDLIDVRESGAQGVVQTTYARSGGGVWWLIEGGPPNQYHRGESVPYDSRTGAEIRRYIDERLDREQAAYRVREQMNYGVWP